MAIAIALAVVTTSAAALFSSTATVSGVTFSTGNATLQVWNKTTSTWVSDFTPSDFLFQDMYPGYSTFQTFSLMNNSTSNIKLTLNAKLHNGATQDPSNSWETLKDKVEVRFANSGGSGLTGWATLNYWNTTGHNFDTGLAKGEHRWYRIEVRVAAGAGNEISEKHLTNMQFDFTGTQE